MYVTEASLICLESGLALLHKALSSINTPMTFDPWDKSMGLISGCRLDCHLQGPDTMVINAALCACVCGEEEAHTQPSSPCHYSLVRTFTHLFSRRLLII